MKIGILSHNYPKSSQDRADAGIFIYDFAHELAKRADVFIFCPDFGGKKEKYKTVPVSWFDWGGSSEKFGNWKIWNPKSLLNFYQLITCGQSQAVSFAQRNRLDYCLACWSLPSAIFAKAIMDELGVPYGAWSLGSDLNKYVRYPILGEMIKSSLRSADLRFANSYILCDRVKEVTGLDCSFMPAITDFDIAKIKSVKPKLDKHVFNFLYVGRFELVKGTDILVEAIRVLAKGENNFMVTFIGDGTLMPAVKQKIDGYRLGSKTNLLGTCGKDVIAGYMLASDSLVIPSRSESLPLVLLEAAKSGLPIISTDVGDCKRMTEDYNVGYSVVPGKPEELAKVMRKMMHTKTDRKVFAAGLRRISQDFTQKTAVDTLMSAISK